MTEIRPADEAPAGDEPAAPTADRTPLGASYRKVFTSSVISNLGDGVAQIGYPWLASAVTRNPVLIAMVAVAQRLPWLVFTLPAGVITDRVDRRRLMVRMDLLRGVLTTAVAVAVVTMGSGLPKPSEIEHVTGTRTGLFLILLVASLLLGCAEVLRDNSAQTIVPSIVRPEQLERANGRMWSAEQVANTFVGPPLGSLLLAGAFFLPFVLDAVSFFAAAGLMALVAGQFRARPADAPRPHPGAWKAELSEGVSWLMRHSLLRPMAIILGIMNAIGMLQFGTLVLFAQEVLHTTPLEFALLSMGAAVGGVVGGFVAPAVSRALGSGPSLWLVLASGVILPIPIAFTESWVLVFACMAVYTLFGVVWNVITVSLRQSIIPNHLLGRVNSVYRFFAWGMMPIGTAIGGVIVAVVDHSASRETALRAPWLVSAVVSLVLLAYAIPKLTTERLEAARAGAPG